jgi:hypothetical protein
MIRAKPHAKELRVPYETMGADVLDATLMRLHSIDSQAYAFGEHFSAQTQLAPQEAQPPSYVHINTTRLRKLPAAVPVPTYAAAQRRTPAIRERYRSFDVHHSSHLLPSIEIRGVA